MKVFGKEVDKDKILYGGLIITFVVLYAVTAFVSFYHAITFFNIANATWLSVLLSFVAEIGQASVLFSILLTRNRQKFLPWLVMIILTTLQVIGNVVSSYDWIVQHNNAGVESFQKSILFWLKTTDPEIFKVVIAWISGALLPIIALSMTALVAQNMTLRAKNEHTDLDVDHENEEEVEENDEEPQISASDLIAEVSRIRPTKEDLKEVEKLIESKIPITEVPKEKEVIPALSDEEIHKMFMDEYENKNMDLYDDEDENDTDEEDLKNLNDEVESLTPKVENVGISQTNGLVDIEIKEPPVIIEEKQEEIKVEEPEKPIQQFTPEHLERIRKIAQDNLKKK